MKKRFSFKCWNCDRTYTLLREITEEQELIVACPYCEKEAVVKLKPFIKEKKVIRRGEAIEQFIGVEYEFPEILPTEERIELSE